MIELRSLSAGYSGHRVLRDISLTFSPGRVLVLLGPNGCGKSTLLRTALGLQPKLGGNILLDGTPIDQLTLRQIAQKAAYLAQSRNIPNIIARRMVLHGRFPYLSYPRRYRPEDYEAAERALRWVGASDIADRPMEALSGGQRQEIYLAMALAQDTQTILMDEPTTYLDIGRQMEVMTIARRLAEEDHTVVMVLHDLCLALRWADEVAVLDQGQLLQTGAPEEIYTSGVLDHVFGVRLCRFKSGNGWQYYCEPGR